MNMSGVSLLVLRALEAICGNRALQFGLEICGVAAIGLVQQLAV
jgi:hypothetical protein